MDGEAETLTDTMILKFDFQAFSLNLTNDLKIYPRFAKKLSFLQAELESFQKTYTSIQLADIDVYKL